MDFKKKFNKILAILMVSVMSLSVVTGCTNKSEEPKKDVAVDEKADKTDKKDEKTDKDAKQEPVAFKITETGVVDSIGREVEIDLSKVERVAPMGNPAQMILSTIVPEKMVGWASKPSEQTMKYMKKEYQDLPEFGAFYGKKSNFNKEALIKENPDLLIDVGEVKGNMKEDIDNMQDQVGVPTIFIEATLDTMDDAYITLGKLFNKEEDAEAKAKYIRETLDEAKEKSAKIKDDEKVSVYYAEGESGLQSNPAGSLHADVIDIVGGRNVYTKDESSGKNMSEVSMEQVQAWNPDVIIVGPNSIYDTIYEDDVWKDIKAVKDKKVYEIPAEPYNWMGRPPMVNRVIGIKWLGNLLYPEIYDYDMKKETKDFYKLFYNYDLSDEEITELLSNSTLVK